MDKIIIIEENAQEANMHPHEYVMECIQYDPRFLGWFFENGKEWYTPTPSEQGDITELLMRLQ